MHCVNRPLWDEGGLRAKCLYHMANRPSASTPPAFPLVDSLTDDGKTILINLPSLGVVSQPEKKRGQFRLLMRRLLDCLYCIACALAASYVVRPVPNAAYWLRAAV